MTLIKRSKVDRPVRGRASATAASFLAAVALTSIGILGVAGTPTRAAELIMFEQPGCPFCRKFDREIAPGYPRSEAGKLAPLRRVNIFDDRRAGIPDLLPAVFTPTFVVVDDDNREVGRLEGYPGEKWFYPEIEALTDKLAAAAPSGDAASSQR